MIFPQEILNKRHKYYSQLFIQFELLKSMKNKEVVFMSKSNNRFCIRGMFITTIEMLNKFFNDFNFYEKDYNIYVSCGNYRKIPFFTTDLTQRSLTTQTFFQEDVFKEIFEYDIFLDFDLDLLKGQDFNFILTDVRKMWQILYTNDIMFNCFFSGSGIQIIIPSKQFNIKKDFFKFDELKLEETKQPFNYNIKLITENIKKRFNLKSLCLKGVGTIHKLRKCEYSLVDDKVILPIHSISNLEEFKKYSFDCSILLRMIKFYKRGLIYHNENKKADLQKFLNKYNLELNLKW